MTDRGFFCSMLPQTVLDRLHLELCKVMFGEVSSFVKEGASKSEGKPKWNHMEPMGT